MELFELEDLGALKHLLNDSFEHSGGGGYMEAQKGSYEWFRRAIPGVAA